MENLMENLMENEAWAAARLEDIVEREYGILLPNFNYRLGPENELIARLLVVFDPGFAHPFGNLIECRGSAPTKLQ